MSITRCFSIIVFVCSITAGVFVQAQKVELPNCVGWSLGKSGAHIMARGINFRETSATSVFLLTKVSGVRINSLGDYIFLMFRPIHPPRPRLIHTTRPRP